MSPEEFRKHCESIFAFLCEEHGFKLEDLPNEKYINEYQARFVTDKTRIVVEGINWGFNIDIRISSTNPAEMKHPSYCFDDLLAIRKAKVQCPQLKGESIKGEVQLEKMRVYASALVEYANDILNNDHSVFPKLAKKIDKRIKEYRK